MRGAWKQSYRISLIAVAAACLGTVGCVHHKPFIHGHAGKMMAVPPAGAVPRELEKVTLPPYVVEPPDQLLIEVVTITREPRLDERGIPEKDEKGEPIFEYRALGLPVQPISGGFTVRPDGTVYLGIWGSVPVAGLTLSQIQEAITDHIARQEDPTRPGAGPIRREALRVVVDVLQYNSKRYYVIYDGGGMGEQVVGFPVTGSETVLDAITNVGGLHQVASKRNVWVARRTPHMGDHQQILPVDWVGITQHGITLTNYQLMPGDRVYVKAQRLVTIDTALARFLTPIERMFGVTLLGASTVNQIRGRGPGFGFPGGF
jgi:polysaccharide export outer membrane protein